MTTLAEDLAAKNPQRLALTHAIKATFTTDSGKVTLDWLKFLTNYAAPLIDKAGPIDEKRLIANEARRGLVCEIVAAVELDLAKEVKVNG